MLLFILVVLLNVYINVCFKVFPKYKIQNFQAVVVNYWACTLIGLLLIGEVNNIKALPQASWNIWALGLGACFITLFTLIGHVTRRNGIGIATTANKISLVLSATISILLYGDTVNAMKIIGIVLAIPAVILCVYQKPKAGYKIDFWPLILFIGSGLLDSMMQYVQYHYIDGIAEIIELSTAIFASAAIFGSLAIIVFIALKKQKIEGKNIIAGLVLGIPNFASIYFFIRLLHTGYFDSSTTISLSNTAIVLLSVATGFILFKEQLTTRKKVGIALACTSLLIMIIGND